MADRPLPPELLELERQLRSREQPDAFPSLRRRIVAAVNLRLGPSAAKISESDAGGFWGFAACVAAAVLIGLNLARVWAIETPALSNSRIVQRDVETARLAVQQIDPTLSPHDARRLIMFSAFSSSLTVPSLREIPSSTINSDAYSR